MTDDDRRRWDRRHRALDAVDPAALELPTVFDVAASEFPSTGHALELACGRGATSVWLARRGLDVLGVDVSPAAIEQAGELAGRAGVADRCRFEVHDLDAGLPDGSPADVIVSHMYRPTGLGSAIIERLVPGGLLAVAVLSEVDSEPGRFRAAAGELAREFAALDVLIHEEGHGRAWLVARRPKEPTAPPSREGTTEEETIR